MPQFDLENILEGYRHGYFLMADEDEKLNWFTSRRKAIIPLDSQFHISRSLQRTLNSRRFSTAIDRDFEGVVRGCMNRETTWITEELATLYLFLHQQGYAHSFETYKDGKLAGGVLGIVLGSAFIGETMFHYQTDGSKVAMAKLVEHLRQQDFRLFDAQIMNPHLERFGAFEITGAEYLKRLNQCLKNARFFK